MRIANHLMFLTLPLMISAPAQAIAGEDGSWSCRNTAFEITCAEGACKAAEEHTPMDVHVSKDEISWCAYSGCWTGVPSASVTSGSFLAFYGFVQREGSAMADGVDVAVTIDTVSNGASIMAAGIFTTPATCAPG